MIIVTIVIISFERKIAIDSWILTLVDSWNIVEYVCHVDLNCVHIVIVLNFNEPQVKHREIKQYHRYLTKKITSAVTSSIHSQYAEKISN